jgi:hypothetical protein
MEGANIRVVVEYPTDFGRTRRIAVLREQITLTNKPEEIYFGYALVPVAGGGREWKPIREGERLTPDMYLLELPDKDMNEFLKAMTVELIRLGYVTGDPHGTKLQAVQEHLAATQKQNDRNHDLLTKFVDAVTPTIRSGRK